MLSDTSTVSIIVSLGRVYCSGNRGNVCLDRLDSSRCSQIRPSPKGHSPLEQAEVFHRNNTSRRQLLQHTLQCNIRQFFRLILPTARLPAPARLHRNNTAARSGSIACKREKIRRLDTETPSEVVWLRCGIALGNWSAWIALGESRRRLDPVADHYLFAFCDSSLLFLPERQVSCPSGTTVCRGFR